MATADGITGYWPYVPYKCAACGAVSYIDVPKLTQTNEAKMDAYDSTQDTLEHIEKVRQNLFQIVTELVMRGAVHDQSKLLSPEKEAHDRYNPRLRQAVYGTDEYRAILAEMGDIPQIHYARNRHHPEHFDNGINHMSLIDIVEMLADWKAATERNHGDLAESIETNIRCFGIDEQLARIIRNTASDLGWL